MVTITLEELLLSRWGATPWSVAHVGEIMNPHHALESKLRRWLPEAAVRRLDRGFARSNTVHPATAQALYSICRAMRPRCVYETGTYWGYSTAFLAAALKDAGEGRVLTFDVDVKAGSRIPSSLLEWVEMFRGQPATVTMPAQLERWAPDLFFQDSVHDYEGVLAELRTAYPFLPRHAVVLVHDFVEPAVRRAVIDALPGFTVRELRRDDPQRLGVAWRDD
jgi:cephalosporin hydroxylase